jgi:hypothetical protein
LLTWSQEPEYPKPGKQQQILKIFEGTWAVEGKAFDEEGKPTLPVKITEVNKMACGGLWLIITDKGDIMGKPFESHSILGYDEAKQKFVASGVDNTTTQLEVGEGTYDVKNRSLTLVSTLHDADGNPIRRKYLVEITSDDSFSTTSYEGPEGKEKILSKTEGKRKKF